MFSEIFIEILLKPTLYDAAKRGTGKAWEKVKEAYSNRLLSSLDIELYYLVEKACKERALRNLSQDELALACEILCISFLKNACFMEQDVYKALNVLQEQSTTDQIQSFKKDLENEINLSENLSHAAMRKSLKDIYKKLEETENSCESKRQHIQKHYDFSEQSLFSFANNGLGEMAFKLQKADSGYNININFELEMFRQSIPAYRGIVYLCNPPLNISGKKEIHISIDFKDRRLKGVRLELKKQSHIQPQDEYKIYLENFGKCGFQEFAIALDRVSNEIKDNLGEIVIAVYVNDFSDYDDLTADISIKDWYFK